MEGHTSDNAEHAEVLAVDDVLQASSHYNLSMGVTGGCHVRSLSCKDLLKWNMARPWRCLHSGSHCK